MNRRRRHRKQTRRQLEVVELLSRPGATQATVSEALGISEQTVKNHLQTVYDRLDVRSLAQAVRLLRRELGTPVP